MFFAFTRRASSCSWSVQRYLLCAQSLHWLDENLLQPEQELQPMYSLDFLETGPQMQMEGCHVLSSGGIVPKQFTK